MAILVEGISVIVRREAIEERYEGGLETFAEAAPTHLYCFDDHLVAVAFGDPNEAEAYCNSLAAAGIRFGDEGQASDVAIADQFHGLLTETDWIELARVDFDVDGHEITVAWLHEGEQHAGDVPEEGDDLEVAVPDGWSYENSMSSLARFIPEGEIEERLEFLRHDVGGMDVYRDLTTGEELYLPSGEGLGDDSDN